MGKPRIPTRTANCGLPPRGNALQRLQGREAQHKPRSLSPLVGRRPEPLQSAAAPAVASWCGRGRNRHCSGPPPVPAHWLRRLPRALRDREQCSTREDECCGTPLSSGGDHASCRGSAYACVNCAKSKSSVEHYPHINVVSASPMRVSVVSAQCCLCALQTFCFLLLGT